MHRRDYVLLFFLFFFVAIVILISILCFMVLIFEIFVFFLFVFTFLSSFCLYIGSLSWDAELSLNLDYGYFEYFSSPCW